MRELYNDDVLTGRGAGAPEECAFNSCKYSLGDVRSTQIQSNPQD